MSTSTDLMTTLAWSLLHFLWQGAGIAALAAAAMQLFRQSTTRYLIGICALALMCMSFGVTFAMLADGAPAVRTVTAADASATSLDVAPTVLRPGSVTLSLARPAAPWRDFAWVARGWLAGVCLLALRVACGLLLLEHLRRRNLSALPVELVERCLALQRRLGISRVVRYCECRLVTVPSVIGFLRPIVLLPLRALTGLSAEQLEVVIAHELGHIKRFDVAVNFLQVVVETLFFFHPAVWWLNKRIRADRENCCDDVAIAACGRTLDYARALAIMEDWRGTPGLSMAATGGDVTSRVARLLGMGRWHSGARSAGVFAAALVLVAALTAGAASIGFSQIVAQVERPVVAQVERRVVAQAERPVVAQAERPVVAQAERPVVAQAERPVAQVERPVLAQVEGPLLAQTRPARRSRDDADAADDEPRTPADAPRGSSFIDEMKSVGFDVLDVDLLVALKVHDVTADYVRRLRDAGFDPDADEVIAMKVHGVTAEDIERARALRSDAELDEVIAMKVHGVTAEDIERARALSSDADLDEVLAMKIHGVTAEDIEQARALGPDVDLDEVLAMKIHGVTAEDIEQARALGFDADLDDVLAMKIHGVTAEDVEQARALGVDIDLDDVIAMKIHGVTPEFINEARSHGFEDLSVDQLIHLKNADVL